MTTLLLLVLSLQGANLDADAGFSGDVFPDSWTRVTATLTYEGSPVEAELRTITRAHFCEPVVYRRPLSLGRKARMRIGHEVYLTGNEVTIDVELVAGGKVLRAASIPLKFVRRDGGRLLVIGAPPPFLVEAMKRRPPLTVARLAPDLLPPTPLPLTAVDAVLIPEPVDLDPGQESALQAWVEQGGKLIFGAGRSTHLRQNAFWRDRCPLATPLIANASLRVKEADVSVTVVRGGLRKGKATLSLGADPLVIRVGEGMGEFVFMPVVLDQPNLVRVIHSPTVLAEIMDIPPPPPPPPLPKRPRPGLPIEAEWLGREAKAGASKDTEELLRRILPPEFKIAWGPLGLGFGIVALYVVLIGPVDYLRLRRTGRLKTGWRSFAVLVVLFSGLLLVWGRVTHPPESRGMLVTLRDEHRVHTFGALRPFRGGVYEFEAPGAVSPVAPNRVYGTPEPPELLTVNLPASVQFPIPPGATRLVLSSRPVEEADGALQVAWAGPKRDAVTVRNSTGHPLGECWLVSKETVWRLRQIPAGFDGTIALEASDEFKGWAGKLRKGPAPFWWMEDYSSWTRVDPSRFGLVLTLHAALDEAWNAGRSRRRMQMRGLDWSPLLERGEVLLIGAFDRNLSGIRPRPEVPVETFGWARARVREASR